MVFFMRISGDQGWP